MVLMAALLAVASCSAPDLSVLPGPKAVDGDTYPLSAEFDDALNLPLGAKVRLQGAIVGEVTAVRTRNFRAYVDLRIRTDTKLPLGTTIQIRFTTPLGEDYLALLPPARPGTATIAAGTKLTRASTSAAPTIEDAFAALSLLLNGGGVDQIGIIVRELDTTLRGRTGTIRTVVEQLRRFVAALNSRRGDIDRALDGLNNLAVTLRRGDGVIKAALDQFPPALRVLAGQTRKLTQLLQSVGNLGNVTADVLNRSTATLLADIDALRPTLTSLVRVRTTLVPTMQVLTRLGANLDAATPGDYINADGLLTLIFSDDALLPPDSAYRGPRTASGASGSAAVTQLLTGSGS